jgi:hypothetical protein
LFHLAFNLFETRCSRSRVAVLFIYIYKNECVSVNKAILWHFVFCFLYFLSFWWMNERMFFSSNSWINYKGLFLNCF